MQMHIQLSKLIWKAFANAHEIVFVPRINCGPCLFPDWRNSWVSLLCSILTLDVNDIGNHFRKHSLHPPALEVCAARRLWILRLSVYTSRMQRKFQLPILLHQNTTLSASDVQLLVSGHITCSPSPPLCLSFHFLPNTLRYALAFTPLKNKPLCSCCFMSIAIFYGWLKRNNCTLILIPKTFGNEKAIKVSDKWRINVPSVGHYCKINPR